MTSWVHLFSKFTSEALLFEAAFICFLVGSYLAYSVIRKRREGRAGEAIPSSVVKVYLNELITDAEQMRAQLFGLLNSSGIMTPQSGNSEAGHAALLAALQAQGASASAHGDSDLLHKIGALEARMKDQSKAMELLIQEKSRIEGELSLARTNAGKAPPAGASTSDDTKELQKRIAQLEGKLAEYSVIEDDLANLKRLQQENTEMKARLQGAAPAPAPASTQDPAPVETSTAVEKDVTEAASVEVQAAAPADAALEAVETVEAASEHTDATTSTAETADAALEVSALAEAAAPAEMTSDAADLLQATAATESTTPTEPAPDTDMAAAFDQLATQVDASLSEPAMTQDTASPAAAAASPASAEDKAEGHPEDQPDEKAEEKKRSEADLLAEFEKMLNG